MACENESKNGPTFHFRDWEGKNTHNPVEQYQDDQALLKEKFSKEPKKFSESIKKDQIRDQKIPNLKFETQMY